MIKSVGKNDINGAMSIILEGKGESSPICLGPFILDNHITLDTTINMSDVALGELKGDLCEVKAGLSELKTELSKLKDTFLNRFAATNQRLPKTRDPD